MNNRSRIQMLILGLPQIVCFFAGYAFRAQDPSLAFVSAGVTTAFVLVVLLAARRLYPRRKPTDVPAETAVTSDRTPTAA